MAQFTKQVQENGTWRIFDRNGTPVARIWLTAHVDRLLRDGDLSDAIAAIMAQPAGAARRTAARTAYQAWTTAGGHSVNFSALTISDNNDAGQPDGQHHIYIAGNELGYVHGDAVVHVPRLARFIRLAEEVWSADQLSTNAEKNAALDAAIDRFRSDGGANGG